MQNSLHRLDHTNFFFFTTLGRSQKHVNGHGSGGHSSVVSMSTPTSFLLLWAIFFSMFMANIWLRKDRLLVFSITCWYGDTALLPITTWPWRQHILHRINYPVRPIRQVNPREWKRRRRRNQQNIFFFFFLMQWDYELIRLRCERWISGASPVWSRSWRRAWRCGWGWRSTSPPLRASCWACLPACWAERGSAEGGGSVEKTSFGTASKDVAFFKRSSNMSRSQEHC